MRVSAKQVEKGQLGAGTPTSERLPGALEGVPTGLMVARWCGGVDGAG
jgi:hypothetical protein